MFAIQGTEDRFDLSHMDTNSLLSSWSKHSINLDDCDWPSVEHYVQAMKYDNPILKEKYALLNTLVPLKNSPKLGGERKKQIGKQKERFS